MMQCCCVPSDFVGCGPDILSFGVWYTINWQPQNTVKSETPVKKRHRKLVFICHSGIDSLEHLYRHLSSVTTHTGWCIYTALQNQNAV